MRCWAGMLLWADQAGLLLWGAMFLAGFAASSAKQVHWEQSIMVWKKESPWLAPVLPAGTDWGVSARGSPCTGVPSVNGLSCDAKFAPEMVLLCCCCPAALSSPYLYLAQFSNVIHHFKSHTWLRNLEKTRGNFLFVSRSYTPPTAALQCPLQNQQPHLTMFAFFNSWQLSVISAEPGSPSSGVLPCSVSTDTKILLWWRVQHPDTCGSPPVEPLPHIGCIESYSILSSRYLGKPETRLPAGFCMKPMFALLCFM